MAASSNRVSIPGSERTAAPGARKVGPAEPTEQIRASVYVRPGRLVDTKAAVDEIANSPVGERRHLTRDEYAATFGADPNDLAKVESFAKDHGLAVEQVDAGRRVVVLAGTVAAMSKAFGVELSRYDHAEGSYRGREGAITIPADVQGIITSVHGLDDRPAARPHVRVASAAVTPRQNGGPYSPVEVATAYDFPTDGDGSGQCVAIIELGGGYTDSDLQAFFQNLGITEPQIVAVGVDGGTNNPNPADNADVEVALDIEVVGAVAPGARMAVYFAPNTDQGFLDAISTAVHDTANAPSVISISWGSPEVNWSDQSLQAFDQAFQAAALMGVTVCCASGDNGSSDGVSDGAAHVDFPSSSPHALACGGTQLSENAGTITGEVVWNQGGGATGGGISDVFDLPTYQASAGIPASANPGGRIGRGVPDIAGNADPATGYQIVVNGQTGTVGGTSAVAPLWAGLIARINSAVGAPAGLVNPLLYANPSALHDITVGNNGAYNAASGWDACTGLGSPDGKLVRQALAPKSSP
jgi:kumamolisin